MPCPAEHDIPSSGAGYTQVIVFGCKSLLPAETLVLSQIELIQKIFLFAENMIFIVYTIKPVLLED